MAFGFTYLTGTEIAGYTSINTLITSIDTQLTSRVPNKDTSGSGSYNSYVPIYDSTASSGFTQGLINTSNITDGAVTVGKLGTGAVTAVKLNDTLDLTTKAITVATATPATDNTTKVASTGFVQNAISSALTGGVPIAAAGIASNAIETVKILDGAVTSAKIADGTIVNVDVNNAAAISYSKLNLAASVTSADIVDGTIVNGDISNSAGIVDTKLATIATAGKVSNSATTATSANTASAIVARDASGNFSAGTITANLTGNTSGTHTGGVTGNVTGNVSGSAASASSATNASYATSAGSATNANYATNAGIAHNADQLYNGGYAFYLSGGAWYTADNLESYNLTSNNALYLPGIGTTTSAANARRGTSAPYVLTYNTSSRRFKTNIEQYVLDTTKILSMRGVTFTSLCEEDDKDLVRVGFIAEEAVDAGMSEFVDFDDEGVPQNFDYSFFTAALLELCKYQESRIDDLEARLTALEAN